MMNGRFVKEDLWLPTDMNHLGNRPVHLAICHHANWMFVREDIEHDDPSWPIRIVRPGQMLRGIKITGYTVSNHCLPFTHKDFVWLDRHVEHCRIPEPTK